MGSAICITMSVITDNDNEAYIKLRGPRVYRYISCLGLSRTWFVSFADYLAVPRAVHTNFVHALSTVDLSTFKPKCLNIMSRNCFAVRTLCSAPVAGL